MTLQVLIDKQDSFEIIREQILAILVAERASQMALAVTAGKDPELWNFRLFDEQYSAWEFWLENPTDVLPIVNVMYNGSSMDTRGSNRKSQQKTTGTYYIDCYGHGIATDEIIGHSTASPEAAKAMHRIVRLIRNILMASEYTYLELRANPVWDRWVSGVEVFRPIYDDNPVQGVIAGRMTLTVTFNELSPQYTGETIELVTTTIKNSNGEIILQADFNP